MTTPAAPTPEEVACAKRRVEWWEPMVLLEIAAGVYLLKQRAEINSLVDAIIPMYIIAVVHEAQSHVYTTKKHGSKDMGGKIDLSGTWKQVKQENYESILTAQGLAGWQRSMVMGSKFTHVIDMDKDHFNVQVIASLGTQSFAYTYDSEPIKDVRKVGTFWDTVSANATSVTVRKENREKKYDLVAVRTLEPDRKTLVVDVTFTNHVTGDKIFSKQWYVRES